MQPTEMRQVKMAESLHGDLKQLARQRSILLRELYDEAIRWFAALRNGRSYDQYLISPREGVYKSMWITTGVAEVATDIAAQDGVPQNRVIYTSLFLFFQDHCEASSVVVAPNGRENTVDRIR